MIEFPSTTAVNRILPKDKFVEHLDLTPNLKKKLISDVVHIKILNKFSKSVLGFRDLDEVGNDSIPPFIKGDVSEADRGILNNETENLSVSLCSTSPLIKGSNKTTSTQVEPLEKITEVLLLQIDLKKPDFDSKLVEAIARQNPHKLVFLLRYLQYAKLAVFYKKLYIGSWKPFEEVSLTLNGNNMNEVWLSFVGQVALREVVNDNREQRPLSSLSATLPPAKLGADLDYTDEEGSSSRCSPKAESCWGSCHEVTEGVLSKKQLDHQLDLQNKAEALKKEIVKLESAIRKEKQPKRKFEMHQKMLELVESLERLSAKASFRDKR